MKCIYEKPQQKELRGSLQLVVAAGSWNDGENSTPWIEGNPDHDQEERVKDRGWDVFGE